MNDTSYMGPPIYAIGILLQGKIQVISQGEKAVATLEGIVTLIADPLKRKFGLGERSLKN